MNQKIILLCVILASLSINVFSQDTLKLDIANAVALTLQESKILKISESKIEAAKARLGEAKFNQYPSLNLGGTYLRLISPTINVKSTPPEGQDPGNGGMLGNGTPDISQAVYGSVNVTQPLFSGLKLRHMVTTASFLEKAAVLNKDNTTDDVILNSLELYFTLFKLHQTRKVLVENLNQVKKQVYNFTNLVNNGILTRNDLLKIQLQQSNIELNLLNVDNQISSANYQYNILLGIDENTVITMDTLIIKTPRTFLPSFQDYTTKAFAQRKDLAASEMYKRAAGEQLKVAKGNYYPSIALTGGYISADIPNFISITNALNFGLGFKYSITEIFNTTNKIRGAKASVTEAEMNSELLTDNIKTELYRQYNNYQTELKRLETLEVATELADENYKSTLNNYKNQLSILTDVLEAQVNAIKARVDLINAQADIQLSFYQLEKASGNLESNFTK